MRLSSTLSAYIGRKFLASFLVLFCSFLTLILILDMVELLRRAGTREGIGFAEIVEMALLKLPFMGQQTFPFAILFGGMATFWRLNRHHELHVTRAAGVSAWQFLLPVLAITVLLGLFKIMIFNPLSSTTLAQFERMEAKLLEGRSSFSAISKRGLWLRQAGVEGQTVIHAGKALQSGAEVRLDKVSIFNYEGQDRFVDRIEAQTARLRDGYWQLENAWVLVPEQPARLAESFRLPTDLTLHRIQDSFAPPETLSFWSLPGFIDTLEKAGFSAVRHRLHWHSLLAAPLLMSAMALVAAAFTLRQGQRSNSFMVIAAGVMVGFLFYFFADLVFAMGLSDNLPVVLAAWTPAGVMFLLGLATLFHLEDG